MVDTAISEKPILYQGPMVRALLAGTKTQTRRVAKFKTDPGLNLSFTGLSVTRFGETWSLLSRGIGAQWEERSKPLRCPYGTESDRLWVREAFSGIWLHKDVPPSAWERTDDMWYWADGNPDYGDWTPPKPSIHMPRWASRILLEVTDVRVERLQSISEDDALAEGISGERVMLYANKGSTKPCMRAYVDLWGSINGDDGPNSWAANPWVFAISFRRLKP